MDSPLDSLRFDPSDGTVIRRAPGEGYGNWVGGKASYDEATGQFVLFYRLRQPLESGRAGECRVAVSTDGLTFEDVWRATKEELAANSVEEGHCVRDGEEWLLYVSYEIAGTSIWRIDLMVADDPSGFSAQSRRTVLSPQDFGLAWIKDPYLRRVGGQWWLYAAAAPRQGAVVEGNTITSAPLDATVLAKSDDGRYFPQIEYVFEAPADDSWHGRRARINSMIPYGEGYVAFFDGGRTFYDNYEEKAGLATSDDGVHFERLDDGKPWVESPHGIVRYVSAARVGDRAHLFYEYTNPDGSHDLRTSIVEL